MHWIDLNTEEQLDQIREESKERPVLIFKYSTRCSISNTMLKRFERNWEAAGTSALPIKFYFLDLLSCRKISNLIAEYFDVEHQSPQILLVENAKLILVRSHLDIDAHEVSRLSDAKS